jgi:hypothetical protein
MGHAGAIGGVNVICIWGVRQRGVEVYVASYSNKILN